MGHFHTAFLRSLVTGCVLVALSATDAFATIQLSRIFANGMVLQRNMPIHIWGTANAGDSLTVSFLSSNIVAVADSNGKWRATLPAKSAGGPYSLVVLTHTQTISLDDVYVGDVWLASGQSNMEMQVNYPIDSASALIAAANFQTIRQFKVVKALANDPTEDLPSGSTWTPATSTFVGSFSAVAYLFARDLYQDLSIPIGIINSSYGGSRIEAWMSKDMLGYDEGDTVLASGAAERQPTVAFNAMINPILAYPIKGIIWYQGESNADVVTDAVAYSSLFKTMISGWRTLWGLGDIPFLWVQLPGYGEVYSTPQTWDAWPQLRAAQTSALVLPNTGEAVTIDVGSTDIHPTHKIPVGHRLALIARNVAYGESIVSQGPRYKSNRLRDDGKVEISFDNVADSLVAKDSTNGGVGNFAIAGPDNTLMWAHASIDHGKILVWNPSIPYPALVRYAWEYNPINANLYNSASLPAAPFLADVYPGFKITRFLASRSPIERGQSVTLTWNVYGASAVTLNGTAVDSATSVTVSPTATTTYTLLAVNRDDSHDVDTARVTIEVLDPDLINRALAHSISASTYAAYSGDSLFAAFAVDGNMATRWNSAWQTGDPNRDATPDDEWIAVNLTDVIDLSKIVLSWGGSFASEYNVDVSFDGYLWTTARSVRDGDGGADTLLFADHPAGRYLRIHCLKTPVGQGYGIFELAAYGRISAKTPPTVALNTSLGNVLLPGASVTITATASARVVKAEFYVDGNHVGSDSTAPFQVPWVVDSTRSEHTLTAIVTDDSMFTVQSVPLTVYVDNGTITRYEAEEAQYTGKVTVVSLRGRSGGHYLQMQSGWVVTFNTISVPSAGDYLLTFCYQLTYDTPKTQYLLLNGRQYAEVEFTAPSTSAWMQKGMMVPLNAGVNEITLDGYWEWMSLDYIGVRGSTAVGVDEAPQAPTSFALEQNYPNPFNPTTNIKYQVSDIRYLKLVVYDMLGREVAVLVNERKQPGEYTATWNAAGFASGVYICRLIAGSYVESRKMLLLK
jgi:hypothetical protein